MKIALINDTHFGARNDSLSMQRSQKQFLDTHFFPTLQKENIKTVVHAGDYVDRRKHINFQTAQFMETEYRSRLRAMGIYEYVLVGNHDAYYRQSNDVNAIEELYRNDDSLYVVKNPREVNFDGLDVLFLPWITDDNLAAFMQYIQTSQARVVIGHLELLNFQMYRGSINDTEGLDPSLFGRFDLVLSGHYHHKSEGFNVKYLGAPWPMVWSDFNDDRGFHLLNTDTLALEYITNPYTIFRRYVYDDEGKPPSYIKTLCQTAQTEAVESYVKVIVKSKKQPFWFDMFVDEIQKANPLDLQIIDEIVVDEDALDKSVTADMDTSQVIREYVNSITLSCPKDKLQDYLDNVYKEAMTERG